jgi:NAD(P)H-dependent FMN reductase
MRTKPRTLVFAGSTRAGSSNAKLAPPALKELALTDMPVTHVSLADYAMPLYDGDLETASGQPEAAKALFDLMVAHEGIFVAAPEYNAGITPLLKNTIDWVSRIRATPNPWKNRVWALGAASPGGLGGYRGLIQLRQSLVLGLGVTVLPEQVTVARATDAFAETGALKDDAAARQLRAVLGRLAEEAERYAAARPA